MSPRKAGEDVSQLGQSSAYEGASNAGASGKTWPVGRSQPRAAVGVAGEAEEGAVERLDFPRNGGVGLRLFWRPVMG